MGVATLSRGLFPTRPTSCSVCGRCFPHIELALGWHTLPGPCRAILDCQELGSAAPAELGPEPWPHPRRKRPALLAFPAGQGGPAPY